MSQEGGNEGLARATPGNQLVRYIYCSVFILTLLQSRHLDYIYSLCIYQLSVLLKKYLAKLALLLSPTCGHMPLPALSLWPGRQPCRPRPVDGRRGGGPSSVAPRSHNPPTGRHRDSPISSSLFLHGPLLGAVG